jgi:hypothetical protein
LQCNESFAMNIYCLLASHKYLSLIRKTSFKQNLFISATVYFILIFFISWFLMSSNFLSLINTDFLTLFILIFDFSIRFLFKQNQSVGILPYLCIPIPKQVLIFYILISELTRIWIWGCIFIYCLIFYQCSYLNVHRSFDIIIFLVLVLFNNYIIYLFKISIRNYVLLLFPSGIIIIAIIQSLSFIMPSICLFISCLLLFILIIALNKVLKKDLYTELDEFAF